MKEKYLNKHFSDAIFLAAAPCLHVQFNQQNKHRDMLLGPEVKRGKRRRKRGRGEWGERGIGERGE